MKLPVILSIVILLSVAAAGQTVRTESWLEDFGQLKKEMSSHYANLEWAVAERGVDLKKLSSETESKLRDSKTDAEAMLAIQAFLQNFGDGHLRVEWRSANAATAPAAPSGKLCERLGFKSRPVRPGVDLTALKDFKQIDVEESKYIPAGSSTLTSGKRFGIVRIGLFDESVFPGLCEAAAAELKLSEDSACDDECQNRVRMKAANLYAAALASQVERLKKEKIELLVVDLTGNGGGNDVYQPMSRMLTAKPLRSPAAGFIRHPHWIKQNRDRVADLESEFEKSSGDLKKMAATGLAAARRDVAEAEKPCDLSPLWENQKPSCSNVVAFDKSGITYAKPGQLSNTNVGSNFFGASRYTYTEGVWQGRLAVLMDARTASASEAMAAMLRDNGAATLVGQPSLGAGCGYTNGGIVTILKNSNARVRMPDCVRFRADGSNEINGLNPDVTVHWRQNDSPFQRATRAVVAFESLLR